MKTFETSRLVSGNRVFPTKIEILTNKLVITKPGVFSKTEKTIPFSKIVSVMVKTPLLNFSSVSITTETETIKIEGLSKNEAIEIRDSITN